MIIRLEKAKKENKTSTRLFISYNIFGHTYTVAHGVQKFIPCMPTHIHEIRCILDVTVNKCTQNSF